MKVFHRMRSSPKKTGSKNCGTIKIPASSKALGAEQRPKFCSPSLTINDDVSINLSELLSSATSNNRLTNKQIYASYYTRIELAHDNRLPETYRSAPHAPSWCLSWGHNVGSDRLQTGRGRPCSVGSGRSPSPARKTRLQTDTKWREKGSGSRSATIKSLERLIGHVFLPNVRRTSL